MVSTTFQLLGLWGVIDKDGGLALQKDAPQIFGNKRAFKKTYVHISQAGF